MRNFTKYNLGIEGKDPKDLDIGSGPKRILVFAAVAIVLSNFGFSDEHMAASLSPADVQAAVNAASAGDTVVLPAGDYSGFNTPVDIYSQISLRGQGKNSTILRKTSTASGWGVAMFRWCQYRNDCRNQRVNSYIEIRDFTLYGEGGYDQTTQDTGIMFHNIDYGTTNLRIHDVSINRFGDSGIMTDGWPFYGVIYDCNFNDCYLPGLGYGVCIRLSKGNESYDGITSYNAAVNWGQSDWLFIEDCTFTNCRHCVNGAVGGRFVLRHCSLTPANDWIAPIVAHGFAHAYGSTTPIAYGTRAMDIYNNTIRLLGPTVNEAWIWIYGGSVRAHDNIITGTRWNQDQATYVNDPSVASGPISYPHINQATDIYLWNNTIDGSIRNATVYNPYGYVGDGKVWQEGRDFFYYAPPGYVTYPYPHPLRQGIPHISLSPSSLQFSAIAGGSKPANQTFQISNSGGGTLNWSVSDNANWLTCLPTSGTDSASVTVSVDQAGLSAGTYNASITVSSANADNSPQNLSVSLSVTASAPPLSASVTASPTSGQAPLAVNFIGSVSGGATPYSYRWTFGDGGSSTTQNPSHTYSANGNYTATMIVTDSSSGNASATVNITVGAAATVILFLFAETGAPATGQGGTTDPPPGSHPHSIGSAVTIKSIPNTDYRFSKWSGDVPASSLFNSTATLTMNTNKSVSGTFCSKCGDANGDLKITPADAQEAFDIFLGKIANPTSCELENADVNCDGTKVEPKVTPGDAQIIFNKYLMKDELPSDCSGRLRSTALLSQKTGPSAFNLIIVENNIKPGDSFEEVDIIADSLGDIGSFGFDLIFPSEGLTFIGLERTEISRDFIQVGAHLMASNLLRVGGYAAKKTSKPSAGSLVTLIFKISGKVPEPDLFSIIALYDDIHNASMRNGGIQQKVRESNNIRRKPRIKKNTPSKMP
jgi:PKD repeat protein